VAVAKKRVDRWSAHARQPLDLGLGNAGIKRSWQQLSDVLQCLIGDVESLAPAGAVSLELAPERGAVIRHARRSVNSLTSFAVPVNLFTQDEN
jgi:hypothetical protein